MTAKCPQCATPIIQPVTLKSVTQRKKQGRKALRCTECLGKKK